jgi:O-antigen ligase
MVYSISYYRNWCSLIISVLLLSLASVILVYNPPSILNKFINGKDLVGDSPRQKIRNFAYYVFKMDPVLGTGIGNFPNFNHDDIRDLVIEDVGSYDDSQFLPFKHPHNIYYAYLTGGGILLFSVFMWFWLQIVNIIYRVNKHSNEKWIVFSGVSVVMTVLSIGWVNTTLAHEHALIVMFVLGVLITLDRKRHAK